MRHRTRISIVAALLAVACAGQVVAQEGSPWLVRVGATTVDPKSNNSDIVNVDDSTSLTFNVTYMFTPNWGFEVLAALPFEHDLRLTDGTLVGSTEHLPPTFSLQYHFAPDAWVQPYIGLGLNYTTFMSESLSGPLEGSDLKLSDSTGLAFQLGVDFMLNDTWSPIWMYVGSTSKRMRSWMAHF
jgi:outer membrane protein